MSHKKLVWQCAYIYVDPGATCGCQDDQSQHECSQEALTALLTGDGVVILETKWDAPDWVGKTEGHRSQTGDKQQTNHTLFFKMCFKIYIFKKLYLDRRDDENPKAISGVNTE